MSRIFNAFFLTILILAGIFVAHIYPSGNIARGLYNILPLISVVGSAMLVTCMVLPHKDTTQKTSMFAGVFFILLMFCGEVTLREFLSPIIIPRAKAEINPEEFLLNGHPLSKKGIFFASADSTYVFGETLLQADGYIGRNLIINQQDKVLYGPFFRIDNGRLFVLNIRTISKGQTNVGSGMEELPLPISFDALYDIWGTPSPQRVSLIALARSPDAFTNKMSYPYRRAVLLAIARYVVSLILLIFGFAIGWSAQNRLKFQGVQAIGSIGLMLITFPLAGMGYYALVLLANNVIFRVL